MNMLIILDAENWHTGSGNQQEVGKGIMGGL